MIQKHATALNLTHGYHDSKSQNFLSEERDAIFVKFRDLDHSTPKRNKIAYKIWKRSKETAANTLLNREKDKIINEYSVNYYNDLDLSKYEQYPDSFYSYLDLMKLLKGRDFNLQEFVKRSFLHYLNSIKDTHCYVLGIKILEDYLGDSDKYVAFEVYNRYCEEWAKQTKNKLSFLKQAKKIKIKYMSHGKTYERKINLNKSVFLTLTYDQDIVKSKEEAWESITKDWNRFKTRLFQEVGHMEYIMTVESQKKGYPHIHALFFGVKKKKNGRPYLMYNGNKKQYKEMKKKGNFRKKKGENPTIEKLWKKGYTGINCTKKGKKIRRPLSYMVKYFDDTWGNREVNEKGFITQAFTWFFNRKVFNMSEGVSKWLKYRTFQEKITDIEGNDYYPDEIEWQGVVMLFSSPPDEITAKKLMDLVYMIA